LASGFSLQEEGIERDRAVQRIEDKIRDLMNLAQYFEFEEEIHVRISERPQQYDDNVPSFTAQAESPNQFPSMTNQTQPHIFSPDSTSIEPQAFVSQHYKPQDSDAQFEMRFQPHNLQSHPQVSLPKYQRLTGPTKVSQQHRSVLTHNNQVKPGGFQSAPETHNSQPNTENILTQTAPRPPMNSSHALVKNPSIKKLHLDRNRAWTSSWFHPAAFFPGKRLEIGDRKVPN